MLKAQRFIAELIKRGTAMAKKTFTSPAMLIFYKKISILNIIKLNLKIICINQ